MGAIALTGEAEQLEVQAAAREELAIRLGSMTAAKRKFSLEAMRAVQEKGSVEGFPPEFVKAVTDIAPVTISLIRLGKVPQVNTPDQLKAVCVGFPRWRPGAADRDLDRHKTATYAEHIENGIALALFRQAKPPAVSDFDRLQRADLKWYALWQAVDAGMSSPGPSEPEWYTKRKMAGLATSIVTERDLLVTVWTVRGVLPESYRLKFLQKLDLALGEPTTTNDEVARIGASLLP